MHIEHIGRDAIVETEDICFSFQSVDKSPREFNEGRQYNPIDWNGQEGIIGEYKVYPYGTDDCLPTTIKDVVQNNSIAPGIITKKNGLLWGSGPKLYIEEIDEKENKLVKKWQKDEEVEDWLAPWAEDYLTKAITDYHHIGGVFTKVEMTGGYYLGNPKIARLHTSLPDRTRLANRREDMSDIATHAIVYPKSFHGHNPKLDYKVYPVFDVSNPFKHANAVYYSNMYSFCTDYYTVPDIYGSLEWLRRSTAIPLILKALSKNSLNLKYHIVSPQAFWDAKEEKIQENCTKTGTKYKESMLADYKAKFLKKVAEVLSGEENAGKFWHTTKSFTVEGTNLLEHGWEINVIDQKTKDYVESQIKISERADRAVSSGINLHGALGNLSSGTSNSGSEQLYALKNYLATGIDIPEMIVMKPINIALRANFPNKKYKLGFYHNQPQAEEDISPSKRAKNQVD